MPEPFSVAQFKSIVERNRDGDPVGTYAVCSAHPWVMEAAIRKSMEDGSLLHLESTSSQVNQLGGYSGQTPRQFARSVHAAAQQAGLPQERVLLGETILGPIPGEANRRPPLWKKAVNWRASAWSPAITRFTWMRACRAVTTRFRWGQRSLRIAPRFCVLPPNRPLSNCRPGRRPRSM